MYFWSNDISPSFEKSGDIENRLYAVNMYSATFAAFIVSLFLLKGVCVLKQHDNLFAITEDVVVIKPWLLIWSEVGKVNGIDILLLCKVVQKRPNSSSCLSAESVEQTAVSVCNIKNVFHTIKSNKINNSKTLNS